MSEQMYAIVYKSHHEAEPTTMKVNRTKLVAWLRHMASFDNPRINDLRITKITQRTDSEYARRVNHEWAIATKELDAYE